LVKKYVEDGMNKDTTLIKPVDTTRRYDNMATSAFPKRNPLPSSEQSIETLEQRFLSGYGQANGAIKELIARIRVFERRLAALENK
jgi:hypothetical protein